METKKIKITCIISSLDNGGCENHLLNVMPSLDREKFEIRIFTMLKKGSLCDLMIKKGVQVHYPFLTYNKVRKPIISILIKFFFFLYASIRLCAHFIFFRPDVAHFFLPASYLLGFPIAYLCRIKLCVMSRRSLNHYQEKNKILKKVELFLHKKINYLLGNSLAVVENLKTEAPSNKNINLIYNGIKPHSPSDKSLLLYDEFGLNSNSIIITCVANYIPYKGHQDLIRALAMLSDDHDYNCFMIGYDSGIQKNLQELANELKISDKIIFTGSRTDVTDFYEIADISVLTSHEEGFSNAILEAMAAGLPMVVTDVGGNSEAVISGENGYVVEQQNISSISKAIDSLLQSKELRVNFGKKSKEIINKKFILENCVKEYENFYSFTNRKHNLT